MQNRLFCTLPLTLVYIVICGKYLRYNYVTQFPCLHKAGKHAGFHETCLKVMTGQLTS